MEVINRSYRLLCYSVFLTLIACLGIGRSACAHPMGNFSINHYARFEAQPNKLLLRYVLDFAEIPTVSERETMGIQGNEAVSNEVSQAYLRAKAITLRDGLTLTIDGKPAALAVTPVFLQFRPGAGGLNTMRLGLDLTAPLPTARAGMTYQIAYQDANYAERTGWKEIVATAGTGAALQNSSVSTTDVSRELTTYPPNPTLAPPQQMDATFTVAPGGASSSASVPVQAQVSGPPPPSANTHTPQDAFTQAIALRKLTPGLMLLGLLIAFVFGSFHAVGPGHGKTMVAAYLVGSRGTARHAVLLGIIVTVTHTLGVFVLGFITLFASRYIVPEKLYPILSVISGLAVFGVGVWLLASRLRGAADNHGHSHDHDHAHGPDEIHLHLSDEDHALAHDHGQAHTHDHDHEHTHDHDDTRDGGHSHGFGHHHHHHVPEGPITLRSLLALGISGGIVPCPSALVVLLSAIALHRIIYGMALITAFSVGLATVLIVIGLMVVSTRHLFERFPVSEGILRRLPVASAAAITLIGIMLVVRAVTQGV